MTRLPSFAKFAGLFAALPVLAEAHPGHDGHELTWDLQSGFVHPFTGFDHIVAAIAVGVWAVQLGGRARWLVPAAFVAIISVGASLGSFAPAFSGLDQSIAASILFVGLMIAAKAQFRLAASLALVGSFAVLQGLAHGAAGASVGNSLGYVGGLALATVALVTVGVGIAVLGGRSTTSAPRSVGWAVALCGLVLLVS